MLYKDLDTSKACLRAVHKLVIMVSLTPVLIVISRWLGNYRMKMPYAQLSRRLRHDVLPKSFVMHVKNVLFKGIVDINVLANSES